MSHREHGMTLLELVVVGLIVAILASIAVPSYRSYVLRANRAEGRAALLALAAAQEKFYLQCNTYAAGLDPNAATDCDTGNLQLPTRSERGYYDIVVTATDVTGWTAAATPAGASPQLDDVRCQRYGLTSTGARSARTSADTPNDGECWGK
jgi:type IV pilus assembly protein PilE